MTTDDGVQHVASDGEVFRSDTTELKLSAARLAELRKVAEGLIPPYSAGTDHDTFMQLSADYDQATAPAVVIALLDRIGEGDARVAQAVEQVGAHISWADIEALVPSDQMSPSTATLLAVNELLARRARSITQEGTRP